MKKIILGLLFASIAFSSLAMARRAQYDEEARAAEKSAPKPARYDAPSPGEAAKRFVGGIKEATVDSTKSFLGETAEGSKGAPVLGTIEGAREGSGTALDHAVKGAAKVATLGYGEVNQYQVEEPESGKNDTGKIKINW